MTDLFEFFGRDGTGALGGGIGGNPIGVISFELAQLKHKLIVFKIADDRVIKDMVAVIVEINSSF